MLIPTLLATALGAVAVQAAVIGSTSTLSTAACPTVREVTKTITAYAALSTSSTLSSISSISSTKSSSSSLSSSTKTSFSTRSTSETVSTSVVVTKPTTSTVSSIVTTSSASTTLKSLSSTTTIASLSASNTAVAKTVSSKFLVVARDSASAYSANSVLNGYGIPYQVLLVPQTGTVLPDLNSTATYGNFGAIVILSEVSYDYGSSFNSALTAVQWNSLFAYQLAFGVRMVRLDVYPSADTGTVAQGGCCEATQEQFFSISNSTAFLSAGLKVGATLSTLGLYHYPATITDKTIATEIAQFGTTSGYSKVSTAGIINNIGGREQMVFFISFATDWSATSNFISHAWIQWASRGLFAGYRRVNLGTQVDDMFLNSDIYYPTGSNFRIRTGDLDAIKSWTSTINAKMSNGSEYFMEIAHNGNGNIEASSALDTSGNVCPGGSISYDSPEGTTLEFQKPLGTGANIWPTDAGDYPYTPDCVNKDSLKTWWAKPANRDVFAHISHTFTHESENNATFSDIFHEISWNQVWLKQVGLDSAKRFSPYGLVPPAITGLHNGDALRAWVVRGIKNAVGDNTRSVLMNKINEHWPLITTIADNGYAGVQITPRWATNIYYNCDTANCTVQEWIDTSAGKGDINTLLELERLSSSRHLLGLHRDPYMFHQANLRQTDVAAVTINGKSAKLSLIQMWVETVVQEMVRIVNWPIISLKHDDLATAFADRMARDQCGYKMTYILDTKAQTITGMTVSTTDNTCASNIPVTIPGSVLNTQGFTTEKIGNDPTTIWVKMAGAPVTFTLTTPIAW